MPLKFNCTQREYFYSIENTNALLDLTQENRANLHLSVGTVNRKTEKTVALHHRFCPCENYILRSLRNLGSEAKTRNGTS